jgi:hypothetical protein
MAGGGVLTDRVTEADLRALVLTMSDEMDRATQLAAQIARELAADAYDRGYSDGYERGARVLSAEWPSVVAPLFADRPDHAELVRRRLHVCCRECRRCGHRDGCARCENRTPETAGIPHPDDYLPMTHIRLEAAS